MIDLSHIAPPDDPDVEKYTDAAAWIARCERRAAAIGLDQRPPRRVLDIATGCGYFPFVCRGHGHSVTATDRPTRCQYFRDVTEALGVDVIEDEVRPFTPLRIDGEHDVITSYMITFNGHRSPALWDVAEWRYLLDNLDEHLAPGGMIMLELNREPSGRCYSPHLRRFFHERGQLERHRLLIRK